MAELLARFVMIGTLLAWTAASASPLKAAVAWDPTGVRPAQNMTTAANEMGGDAPGAPTERAEAIRERILQERRKIREERRINPDALGVPASGINGSGPSARSDRALTGTMPAGDRGHVGASGERLEREQRWERRAERQAARQAARRAAREAERQRLMEGRRARQEAMGPGLAAARDPRTSFGADEQARLRNLSAAERRDELRRIDAERLRLRERLRQLNRRERFLMRIEG